ncbi:nucleoside deaminase [Tautonia marina]|uniref:nucleoside deaminase n=1 Tax=Tautonia marina TaxID=2653855 RepID=UPI001260DF7A|nr:nucleoside deaminase [Tautonia marina]
MRRAIELAREAERLGEVPVGAVITQGHRIVAEAFNLRETLSDPTAHAERLAISLAGKALGTWRLDHCKLYVTLEPCSMCAGSIVLARLSSVYYGVPDPKAGACDSLFRITNDRRLNHQADVRGGLLAPECANLLSQFFRTLRTRTKLS